MSAVCTWVGRKNRVLNGGPGPPRKWHLGGRTPTHMALFVLDILGRAWGVRTPTEMALFVLDILRRARGPGSPAGRALFVGDILGHAWACPRSMYSALLAKDSNDAASRYQYCSRLFLFSATDIFLSFFPAVIAPPQKHCKVVCVREVYNQ